MMALDYNCLVFVGSMLKARKSCACLSIILGREGVNTRVPGIVFQGGGAGVTNFGGIDMGDELHIGRAL